MVTETGGAPNQEAGEHDESAEEASGEESTTSETDCKIIGIPVESPGAIAALAVVSIGMAFVVWRRPFPAGADGRRGLRGRRWRLRRP